jgi:hypothetical protein
MEIGTEISFDQTGFKSLRQKHELLAGPVNEALNYLNEICGFEIDQKIYETMISQGVGGISKEYRSTIAAEMKKVKLRMGAILESTEPVVEKHMAEFSKLFIKISNVISYYNDLNLLLENLTIVNGKAILSEETAETMRKKFCVFVDNNSKIKFFTLINRWREDYDRIISFWNEHSKNTLTGSDKDFAFRLLTDNKIVSEIVS